MPPQEGHPKRPCAVIKGFLDLSKVFYRIGMVLKRTPETRLFPGTAARGVGDGGARIQSPFGNPLNG